MHVRIDDKVDRAVRQFGNRCHEVGRNRRHAVVDEDDVIVTNEQAHIGTESRWHR